MPFLPLVLLLVGQALSRSASFALGWATALFFGLIPGNKGRMVSVISLISVAWVALVAGFAVPLLVGAVADALGVVSRGFDVRSEHGLGIGLAIGLVPPVVAGVGRAGGLRGSTLGNALAAARPGELSGGRLVGRLGTPDAAARTRDHARPPAPGPHPAMPRRSPATNGTCRTGRGSSWGRTPSA